MPMYKTKVEQRDHAWFALADAEHCRLLCCRLTPQGTRRVDELGKLDNAWPGQEHARPTTQGGMTHDVEEAERRFAGEIAGWLQEKAVAQAMDQLVVFAPPRMLGALRKTPFGSLKGHLNEIKGDLMRLNEGQLAEHPLIGDLVLTAPGR
jgi:protein required for attachment to host cells